MSTKKGIGQNILREMKEDFHEEIPVPKIKELLNEVKTKMSKEDFIEGEYYIAKKDTWFIEGTKCLYVEHLYDDRGIFEGEIKLEDITTKGWWNEHAIGDIIEDREACGYDEFIKPKQR